MGLFDGKKGLILGVANDRSIAWAIAKKIMSLKNNPELIKNLSNNCLQAAKKENWDIEKNKLINAIKA